MRILPLLRITPSSDFGSTVLGSKAAADAEAAAEAAAVAEVVEAAADGAVEAPPPLVHAEAAMTAAPSSASSRVDLYMVSSRNSLEAPLGQCRQRRLALPGILSEGRYYRI